MNIIKFLKDWTLPVSITVGTVCYLTFYYVPQLDALGTQLAPVFDVIFPLFVFLTLWVTFCKVDFHQMRPHRWHIGVLVAQLLLVAANIGIVFLVEADVEQKLLWEAMLTCIIGPAASASPVVTGKLGGNISTMTTYVLISSLASALLIPLVFPMFYFWAISLSITTGITVKNIVHSTASLTLLLLIAGTTFVLCWVQFGIGRAIGHHLGEEINAGQALFQKNTALSIWVAYMYLHPVASVGAGCYVLWQNIINSLELWQYRRAKS